MCCGPPDPISDLQKYLPLEKKPVVGKFKKESEVKEKAQEILLKSPWKIEKILAAPPEIRALILRDIPFNDLKAFDIALSKDKVHDPNATNFHNQIKIAIKSMVLKEILKKHPSWKEVVESWKASVEDKIWLVKVFELSKIIKIPQIKDAKPSPSSMELLKQKVEIERFLVTIEEIKIEEENVPRALTIPEAISLLPNLKHLEIIGVKLRGTPNVRMNKKLKSLILSGTQLKDPPDVSQNSKLETLDLQNNHLKVSPNLNRNHKLKNLTLDHNEITTAPDVSQNIELSIFSMSHNHLVACPKVEQNKKLELLRLNNNALTSSPDVTQNPLLESLFLQFNHLSISPKLSPNHKLRVLHVNDNPFSSESKKQLAHLKSKIQWFVT